MDMYGPPFSTSRNIAFQIEMGVDNSHLGNGFGDVGGTWVLFGNKANPAIAMGQWHRIEVYNKTSSTNSSRDGILRWWVDGQLFGDYQNVNYNDRTFSHLQLTPSWDGSEQHSNADEQRFDHIRISAPKGAGGTTKGDTTPPASPVNLRAN
ncbi:hypothetical protein YTPLAS18_24010 [Nitrospira sp.]|nr:hypothetical protein YTPLAS18_24010 [Nitrospira sp.]